MWDDYNCNCNFSSSTCYIYNVVCCYSATHEIRTHNTHECDLFSAVNVVAPTDSCQPVSDVYQHDQQQQQQQQQQSESYSQRLHDTAVDDEVRCQKRRFHVRWAARCVTLRCTASESTR